MDWLALSGRPALVAGAGGLGGASAVALAARGASVVLTDLDDERLESVARTAKEAGGSLRTIVADLRSADRCREVAAEAAALTGIPQIFVHAVGRNIRRPVLELGDEDWRGIVELNLSTAYWLRPGVGGRTGADRSG